MQLWSRIAYAARNLFRKGHVETQLDEEVRAYVDLVIDEKTEAGMPASEARRTALAEFGGIEQVKQTVRDGRAGAAAESRWQDVRFGLRQLRGRTMPSHCLRRTDWFPIVHARGRFWIAGLLFDEGRPGLARPRST